MECRLGEILENAARLCGRDVSVQTIPADWKVLASMGVNAAMRRIAAEKFPMMMRVELRRYRPDWNADEAYELGHQVWYRGSYWELVAQESGGNPIDSDDWKKLEPGEVAAFIAFEQPWENTVIDRGGVDIGRFAYVANPLYSPAASPLRVVGMTSLGIELAAPAPAEVYVKFVPQMPRVSFVEWASGMEYLAGETVYLTATKEVYVATENVGAAIAAVVPGSGAEGDVWQVVRVADEFASYITRIVAADLMQESQGKYQTRAQADAEFEELCERHHEGNGDTRVRTGRFH